MLNTLLNCQAKNCAKSIDGIREESIHSFPFSYITYRIFLISNEQSIIPLDHFNNVHMRPFFKKLNGLKVVQLFNLFSKTSTWPVKMHCETSHDIYRVGYQYLDSIWNLQVLVQKLNTR
jgi:hypothetical protein